MARQQVENINPEILRQCREQIGLSIEQAQQKAKLKTLADIEEGKIYPTVNQIEQLAKRYYVPVWVFLREELPDKYRFNKSAAFRQFQRNPICDYDIRSVIANVERFRKFLLELRNDLEEPIPPFSPPALRETEPKAIAESIRRWLGCSKKAYSHKEWRQMLENNNIFVFTTNKYTGPLKVGPDKFRGLCIYYEILPIIVINSSDTHKAQSFTLFHELGHLLKKQSSLDKQEEIERQGDEEKWCDKFAGEVLMPEDDFLREASTFTHEESLQNQIEQLEDLAKKFKVSTYAFLVRMRHLDFIDQVQYREIGDQLRRNYFASKKKQQEQPQPISRNIAKEALEKYGSIYSKAVTQTYRNEEIGLNKFCKLFGIKKASDALKLEAML